MKQELLELLKTYKWQTGTALLAIVAFACFILLGQEKTLASQTGIANLQVETVSAKETEEDAPKDDSEEEVPTVLVVDVKGAVQKPDLYELLVGSRVNDAIEAAGGFTEQADQKSVNLAQKVADEAVIYVATKEEGISVVDTANPASAGGGTIETGNTLINLNTATEADLQTISGIGAKRAADIIAYREENGGFKSVDDLNNVTGIGDKTLENLKPYVTVD